MIKSQNTTVWGAPEDFAETCEYCNQPLTGHDQREAPYSDGKYLCAACRAEYMDLHHPDPFGADVVPEVAWT